MKFRKKPVVVDAVPWNGENLSEVMKFLEGTDGAFIADRQSANMGLVEGQLYIRTLEGHMHASPGDWIIKGTRGEVYPCKPGPFEDTFEPVE